MSGFKGTPGPWFDEDNPTIFPAGQVAGFEDSGNRHLQVVIYSNSQEEDARLIAAAPDLLDALEDMLSGWKYIRESHGDLYGVGWDRAQNKARDAIAKALGTESDQ